MQEPGCQEFWFALSAKRNHEKCVAEMLRGKGYEEFVPTYRIRRRWSDRYKELELPLFPGYVFCRFDPARRLPILTTPGVVLIVGNGRVPVPVEDAEIEALRAVVASNLRVEPWPYLRVGERVVIESGSLAGLEGILQEVRKSCRIVVSVELLQRSVAVEVDRCRVRPAGTEVHRAVMHAGAGGQQ
jgi:transcription antitermination factor NusG